MSRRRNQVLCSSGLLLALSVDFNCVLLKKKSLGFGPQEARRLSHFTGKSGHISESILPLWTQEAGGEELQAVLCLDASWFPLRKLFNAYRLLTLNC